MNNNEKFMMVRTNIKQALSDYDAHTFDTVLDDVSDCFVERLAKDNITAKEDLRNMFRKSPAWNEELDALVINGTRTHNPDPGLIHRTAFDMFDSYLEKFEDEEYSEKYRMLSIVMDLFKYIDLDDTKKQQAIDVLNKLAPNVYVEGKKKSRIFMGLCQALGIVEQDAGSSFQKKFAIIADEMNSRKIDFKLFVSLGAQHFLTMSNPKHDERGSTLTSCHSLNSIEYTYNNGCTGYARDSVTMIAFTVANPKDAESLNNRKTTRQLFMYKPGGGLLLQSRMYNTSGGTRGEQEESKLYRDLIQREISYCEGTLNLWNTKKYYSESNKIFLYPNKDFGGYADWNFSEFNPIISIKKERMEDFETFEIGAAGLCIICGEECSQGLYCDDHDDIGTCSECDERLSLDDLQRAFDEDGEEVHVCSTCLENYYRYCEYCEEYHYMDNGNYYNDSDIWLCDDCFDEHYTTCSECDDAIENEYINRAIDKFFNEVYVCNDCLEENYSYCTCCNNYVHNDNMVDDVCTRCYSEKDENIYEQKGA